MMGADGVQMGSRFILTDECPTHPKAKEAIIKATDTDSAVTGFSRNNAVRCLKNEFTKEYLEKECSGAPQQELNDFATELTVQVRWKAILSTELFQQGKV